MKNVKLSCRLQQVYDLLPKSSCVADVGADRGELSYVLLKDGKAESVIVSDISKKSLSRAKDLFGDDFPQEQVCFRVGSGFQVLTPGEAEYAVLAGMGGRTISDILNKGKEILLSLKGVVIQSMSKTEEVRDTLASLGFKITGEGLIFEDNHYYFILLAVPGDMTLSLRERLVGPCLIKEKPGILKEFAANEIAIREALLDNLAKINCPLSRLDEIKQEIQFWRGVI